MSINKSDSYTGKGNKSSAPKGGAMAASSNAFNRNNSNKVGSRKR